MSGNRSIQHYVTKYGTELGQEKYAQTLKRRAARNVRQTITGDVNDIGNFVSCRGCGNRYKRITPTHLKSKCTEKLTIDEYITKYPGSALVADNIKKLGGCTEKMMVEKYGEIEGQSRWQQYREKQAETNTFEYKAKKYNFTKDDFDSYNKSRSVTLTNLITKYGEELGLDKWEKYCERQRYTNTLDYFVEKYGEMDGIERWEEYNKNKSKSGSLEYIMQKYSVDLSGAENILAERFSTNFSSKNEKEFIKFIKQFLADIEYTYETKQFCIWNCELNSPTFFDVVSSSKMKIIEYNGDYWHANKNTYHDDFLIKKLNKTAAEIRHRDSIKIKAAKARGFDVFIVWESEYLSDPEKIKEQLINWW